jgi:hypothetical protein
MPGAVLVVRPSWAEGGAGIVGACDLLSTIGLVVEKAEGCATTVKRPRNSKRPGSD